MVRVLREHMPMLEGMQLPPDFEDMLLAVATASVHSNSCR